MNYEPFDQDERLPPPPWSADDPAVVAWEKAHGHDVRLKCYVEYGCQVIEPTLERRIESLEAENQRLRERVEALEVMLARCEGSEA